MVHTRDRPWARKLAAYKRSGIRELVRCDPEDARSPLRLWDRIEGDLVEREVLKQDLERSDVLGLFWQVEPVTELGLMLRLCRDSAGREPVLTDEEARCEAEARRVEAEARRVEAEARRVEAEARVRELEAELARRSER